MNTLWKEDKTDEAVLAVQEMERRGIVGSASLYYDLARCLCAAGRCSDALMQVLLILSIFSQLLFFFLDDGGWDLGSRVTVRILFIYISFEKHE